MSKLPAVLCSVILAFVGVLSSSGQGLNMIFTNSGSVYSPTNIWITVQRGQNPASPPTGVNVPAVTYGTNQLTWNVYTNMQGSNTVVGNVFANPVSLQDINAAGGLTWLSNAASAAVYVSYGAPLNVSNYSLSGISPSATADTNYNIPYTAFELTYIAGSGSPNNQGDITAINYFTAPVRISSFTNATASGTPTRTVGFNPSPANTAAMLAELQAITGNNPNTVLTNSSGQITRVLGPTQFGAGQPNAADFGSYTNFSAYFASLATNNTTTVFSNSSGFNTVVNPSTNVAYENMNVVFVLTNSVSTTTNGYAFSANGTITTKTVDYAVGGNPISTNTQVYSDVTFSVTPGANQTELAAAFTYYGDYSPDTMGTSIVLGGAGWTSFSNAATANGFIDGGGNPAATIVYAQIPGEISTGYDAGFPGSTNTVAQYPSTPLGQLASAEWWLLTNVIGFSDIQSTNGFYNQYADIIYRYSSNTVYGMTYSDRFTFSSPYVSAAPSIGSWLVELGDPLHTVPEPALAAASIVLFMAFAAYKSRNRKKRA